MWLACEVYNTLRRADTEFRRENGRGPTLAELRQLALDLRKRNEGYRQLRSQVVQGIADRFHGARRRFREGVLQARIREPRSEAGRQGLRVPGLRLEGRQGLQRVPQRAEEGRVGATRGACGAPPPARGRVPRARWGSEAGSPALQGGAAHLGVLQIDSAESAYTLVPAIRSDRLMYSLSLSAKVRPLSFFAPPGP